MLSLYAIYFVFLIVLIHREKIVLGCVPEGCSVGDLVGDIVGNIVGAVVGIGVGKVVG